MTWGKISILVFFAALVSGCVQPLKETQSFYHYAQEGASEEDILQAISTGISKQGWGQTRLSSGNYNATWELGNLAIVVDVELSGDKIFVTYRDSINLRYDGSSIHRRYHQETGWLIGQIQWHTRLLVPSNVAKNQPRSKNPPGNKQAPRNNAPKRSEPEKVSGGSGIVISKRNEILTNFHVIEGCRRITADGERAGVVARDKFNDLALLKVDSEVTLGLGPAAGNFAHLRSSPRLRKGEDVIAAGYPFDYVLSSDVKLTEGIVNALAGIKDDSRVFQISAEIQPGNSGGPALDRSGLVIGVVSSKLNELAMAEISGSLPQNVNFAIGLGMVRAFLDSEGIPFTEKPYQDELPSYEIAEQAQGFTVKIECWN